MFILNFVSGVVETLTGGGDDESYDPHKYRKVQNPTTYMETMTHMLKAHLGAGVLAMPSAMARMGLLFGVLGVVIIAIFASYCVQLLIKAQYQVCKKFKQGYMSYPKSIRLAMQGGPPCLRWTAYPFAYSVDGFLIIWQIGLCAIFTVLCAESIKQINDYYFTELSLRLIIMCLYPPCFILCLTKNMKLMAPLSMSANIFTVMGFIFTFFYIIEDDLYVDESMFKVRSIEDIPIFIGIVLFALEAIGVMLAVEYHMEKPKQFTGVCGLFSVGMTILATSYIMLGVFGYLKYGRDCNAVIILDLPQNEKKAQAAKLLFAMALFASYPLQNYVPWQIILRLTKKMVTSGEVKLDYFLRFACATIPFPLAMIAPSLGAFIGLVGVLCMMLLAVIFPAFMDIAVHYPGPYGCANYRLYLDLFIVVAGFFCLFSGVYTSSLEIYDKFG